MEKQRKKLFVIENKSFDVACEGRRMEGIRISKNGRAFRVSISLEKETAWLIDAFEDFYWKNGGKTWGKHTAG